MLCHNSLNSFNLLSSLNQLIIMIQIEYILIISAIMMFAGVFGFLTRRSTLAILLSVELMLNATDLNFAVFNRMLYPDGYEGYFFALFSIAISAAESAIAIAIMINIYRMIKNIQVGELEKMKLHSRAVFLMRSWMRKNIR